nr:MAG TPA: hypothetical protein [Caudoviricetes sp.]
MTERIRKPYKTIFVLNKLYLVYSIDFGSAYYYNIFKGGLSYADLQNRCD